jgi:hypothetical protein
MVNMNALSAQTKSIATQKSGHVELVGPSSIYLASKNGHLPKVRPWLDHKPKMDQCHHQDNGDALAAIYQKILCLQASHVGVKRRPILELYPGFHLSPAARPALGNIYFQKSALIRAGTFVMQGPVRRVHKWDPRRVVFVVEKRSHDDVLTLTTRTDGAVDKFVESLCLAENTFAIDRAMKVYVEHAKLKSKLDVIAAKSKRKSSVVKRRMKY